MTSSKNSSFHCAASGSATSPDRSVVAMPAKSCDLVVARCDGDNFHPELRPDVGLQGGAIAGRLDDDRSGPVLANELPDGVAKFAVWRLAPPLIEQRKFPFLGSPRLNNAEAIPDPPLLTGIDGQHRGPVPRQHLGCEPPKCSDLIRKRSRASGFCCCSVSKRGRFDKRNAAMFLTVNASGRSNSPRWRFQTTSSILYARDPGAINGSRMASIRLAEEHGQEDPLQRADARQ